MSSPDNQNNTEELEEGSRNILLAIAGQLTKGMDLQRVALPTFVLEPRSMLERITDFMSHPELLFSASKVDDPVERFIGVLRYYLSGWHIKPKGVKKPYNPVLGEFFRCEYKYSDGSEAFYLAEQVSHHPPISAYLYTCPDHHVVISGDIRPKSRFYGNSVGTIMEGSSHVILTERYNERYDIDMPNMYARGVLFGTMTLELGDKSRVSCKSSDLSCELEFKSKGFFSGQWNSVVGKIKKESTQEVLYEITGQWSNELFIKNCKTSQKDLFFDAKTAVAVPKAVASDDQQEDYESRKLWAKLTQAIKDRDMEAATDAKTAVEDHQRQLAKEREGKRPWKPRFFDEEYDDYRLKALKSVDTSDTQQMKTTLKQAVFSKSP